MNEQEEQRIKSALDQYAYNMTEKLTEVIYGLVLKLKPHMTPFEYQTITSETNLVKKIELLIASIRTRPLETFDALCNALEEMKHGDLASDLRCKFNIISYSNC